MSAQVSISVNGNMITFQYDTTAGTLPNNSGGDFDPSAGNLNLYSWSFENQNSTGVLTNLAGGWPGMAMTDLGSGVWEITLDASASFPDGTAIDEINFIVNNASNQTADLVGSDYGFTPFTVGNMSVSEVNVSNKAFVADNQLIITENGNYQVAIFNVNGKMISNFQITNGTTQKALNLREKGVYFIQIQDENGKVQNIKTLY